MNTSDSIFDLVDYAQKELGRPVRVSAELDDSGGYVIQVGTLAQHARFVVTAQESTSVAITALNDRMANALAQIKAKAGAPR